MIYLYLRNSKSGGALKYAHELLVYFENQGIQCFVESNSSLPRDGFSVVKFVEWNNVNLFWRSYKRISFIKEMKVTTVFVPYQILPISFLFTRTKNVLMVRNMEPFEHWRFKYALRNRFRNVALKYLTSLSLLVADKVICVARHVSTRLWYLNETKKVVIEHGINSEEFDKKDAHAHKLTAVIVGSGLPYRGLEDILGIRDQRIINRYRFLWLGDYCDNRYKRRIEKLVRETDIDFEHIGHVPRREVLAYIEASDVYIASSRIEACPNTALEAISLGAKIIALETPSHVEFFPPSTLFYRENLPHEELAKGLLEIANMP